MKFNSVVNRVALGAGALVVAGAASADGGLDFSGVTSAISATTIVTAISAIAAIKILPGVAKWGYNKVIGWFA